MIINNFWGIVFYIFCEICLIFFLWYIYILRNVLINEKKLMLYNLFEIFLNVNYI